jgi:hypothetical protein
VTTPPDPSRALLQEGPRVINVGLESFAADLEARGVPVVHVGWRPPAGSDETSARHLATLQDGATAAAIDAANASVLGIITAAHPVLVDCRPAREAMGLEERVVLHAGPPLQWNRACPTMQAAVLCAIRYEGWAADDAAARDLVDSRGAVGPMTGLITASMPVFVVENRAGSNRAYATINEGLGAVLRFGANDERVIRRLQWLAAEAGPTLGAALRSGEGVDLRAMMGQALRMGDEMHQRNIAASALLVRRLMPALARAGGDTEVLARLAEFIGGNDQFFLNLAMAAGKASTDPALEHPGSTLVVTMARNGTDFGIRVAGLGDRWLTAPVNTPNGLYFAGYGPEDANPDIGDSAIVETIGLGGLAMAAAPAVAGFVGAGGLQEAIAITEEMAEITVGEHPHLRIPNLDDRGTPVGIDVRRVVETGIACFEQALAALATTIGGRA